MTPNKQRKKTNLLISFILTGGPPPPQWLIEIGLIEKHAEYDWVVTDVFRSVLLLF